MKKYKGNTLVIYEVWLDHITSGKNLYKKFKVNNIKTAIEATSKFIQKKI